MVDVAGVTLLLTRRCNAQCAHCGFASGPKSRGDMTPEQARGFVSAAREEMGIRSVAVSGGEPMLRRELVLDVLTFAAKLGLETELVTNSFWARTPAAATAWLERLRDRAGLASFVTSCDDFHQRFVPVERVRNAVQAALRLGLRVNVKAVAADFDASERGRVASILGVSEREPGLRIDTGTPVPEGRARGLEVTGAVDSEGACDQVIRYASVDAQGDLYACCSFGGRPRLVGRVSRRTIGPALRRMQRDLLLNLLAAVGPAGVWRLAKLGPIPAVRNVCDLCNQLYEEPRASAVARMLNKLVSARVGRDDPTRMC